MRYFIRLSFDGTTFHGWQNQKNANSIQSELNRALGLFLRDENIETTGCGRTDTGVHAKKFYAHFDRDELHDAEDVIHHLNSILPHSIAVHSIVQVDHSAHARFDATSRTYEYKLYQSKNPFLSNRAFYFPSVLDFERMNKFAEQLKRYSDFSSFSKSNTQTSTNNCVVTFAEWKQEGDEWYFRITANRFLRNMVRAIVGTLLNVGMGKISEKEFEEIMASKDRSEAGVSVPAHGLYLTDIVYPFKVS
jgi:tRNA pseudouridine38-40 synthase